MEFASKLRAFLVLYLYEATGFSPEQRLHLCIVGV